MPFSAPASVFEQALATFPSASQDLILQAMAAWSTADALGPRVVANLRKERFLSVAHMRELLAVLLDHGTREPVDWAALRRAYISTCWQRSLEGNEVLLEPRPSMIGRAVTRDRFVRQVFDAFDDRPPRSVTLSQVEEFIDDLLTSPDPEIPIEKAGWLMSRRASWVTWNEHDPGGRSLLFRPYRDIDRGCRMPGPEVESTGPQSATGAHCLRTTRRMCSTPANRRRCGRL